MGLRLAKEGYHIMRRLTASVLFAAAFAVAPAFAQTASSGGAPKTDEEIVVRAERLREAVRGFVEGISEPGKEGQLARWDRKVCPGVIGAPIAQAQALNDQIARRVQALDLKVGAPGCKANVLIILTPDSDTFTPQFVEQNPKLFSVGDDFGNTRGRTELNQFANTPRPIRWWHVGETVTDRGQVLGKSDATPSGTGDGFSGVQVARVSNAGRLTAGTREDFNRVIVIVDARAVDELKLEAVADYIAMVSLAQLNPDAKTDGADTVLNLFSAARAGNTPPPGMTEWDTAYLEGLYGAPRYARNARRQQGAITVEMEDELTKPKAQ